MFCVSATDQKESEDIAKSFEDVSNLYKFTISVEDTLQLLYVRIGRDKLDEEI